MEQDMCGLVFPRDLSGTSIGSVPSTGLSELESLIIKDTYTLKTIPSIYDFLVGNLKNESFY